MLKGRKKDMVAFQQSLQDMQRQAQEMEQIKVAHLDKVLSDEQKNFMFLVQKAAGVVKSEYDHFTSLSMLSRDVTEEIITIAFAPPGKALDAAEKRRVVDKFLGAPTGTQRDSSVSMDSGSMSFTTGGAGQHRESTVNALAKMAAQSASSSMVRPATPPISPQPTEATTANTTTATATTGMVNKIATSFTHARTLSELSLKTKSAHGGGSANADESSKSSELDMALERLNQAASKLMTNDEEVAAATNGGGVGAVAGAPALAFKPSKPDVDLVTAIHDFTARTDRELSFKKNDVLLVKQRQESWLYATHYNQPGGPSGWIPVSYTAKN